MSGEYTNALRQIHAVLEDIQAALNRRTPSLEAKPNPNPLRVCGAPHPYGDGRTCLLPVGHEQHSIPNDSTWPSWMKKANDCDPAEERGRIVKWLRAQTGKITINAEYPMEEDMILRVWASRIENGDHLK